MQLPQDMERVLSQRLGALGAPAALEAVSDVVVRMGSKFDADACGILAERLDDIGQEMLLPWLATLPDTPNGAWLRAQFLSDAHALAGAWERFCSFQERLDPIHLLAWARALVATPIILNQ